MLDPAPVIRLRLFLRIDSWHWLFGRRKYYFIYAHPARPEGR